MGHLVKALGEETEDLKSQKALQFMQSLYGQESDVLHDIGMQNVSQSRLRCLDDLTLTATYSCLKLFFHWVDQGFYDFRALPFPLKAHLSKQDHQALKELPLKWKSTIFELMNELLKLTDVLKHSEPDIMGRINEAAKVRRCNNINTIILMIM